MDLKSKSWAGSIYHKFEAICQEVDDFVSKDTVKFVENQVQSVGVSVKRLYSDVVRDIHPPLGDDIKPESQPVTGEHVKINDYMKLVTGIIAKPNCVIEKERSVDQDSIDTLNKHDISGLRELDHVIHCTNPHCTIPSQEAKSNDLSLTQDGDAIVAKNSDKSVEENNADFFPNISSIGSLSESESPLVQESNSNENRSIPSDVTTNKVHEENTLAMDLSSSSACEEAHKAPAKDEILHDSVSKENESVMVSTTVQSSKLEFSNEEAEMGVIPSSFLTSPESSNLLSTSHPVTSILESNAMADNNDNTSKTHGSVSKVGSPDRRLAQCDKEAELTHLLSFPESGNPNTALDIGNRNMETVDLSADVRLDDWNGKFVHTSYHRRKNFRYYKKLLHDAFTSRKRLSKEYEHLFIMHGDIDMESRQNFQPNSLPSSPTTSGDTQRSFSDQKGRDSDWELL